MKTSVVVPALLLAAASLFAQKAKSGKEREALQKVQDTNGQPAAQLLAIDDVLTRFADTEFKPMLLSMAVSDASQLGDYPKTVIYGERDLEANPKDFNTLYTLAAAIVQHTREHDLDKEEKLKKAAQYCNDGIAALKTAAKPNAQMTDAQWEEIRKNQTAAFYTVLGTSADLRKDYPDAIEQFKLSLSVAAQPDAITMARLAKAYNGANQYDDAIAMADKAIAAPDVTEAVKQFALREKDKAAKAKAAPPVKQAP
jgi:tetratricopeptide (TPR) repeat protein